MLLADGTDDGAEVAALIFTHFEHFQFLKENICKYTQMPIFIQGLMCKNNKIVVRVTGKLSWPLNFLF